MENHKLASPGPTQNTLWLLAWRSLSGKSGELTLESDCSEFTGCSLTTRLIARELWRSWHARFGGPSKQDSIRLDAISIEGETLVAAAAAELLMSDSDFEIAQVACAVSELRDQGLVVQRTPGRWELYFGASFTKEELDGFEQERASIRDRFRDGADDAITTFSRQSGLGPDRFHAYPRGALPFPKVVALAPSTPKRPR